MGLIKIDSTLEKSEVISELFIGMLEENRDVIPKFSIPKILAGKLRPGLSSDLITTSVISRFQEIGIQTGPLENGNPNVMENFAKIIIEELVESIHNDLRIDTAVDPGMIVQSAGISPAGPVTSVGSNSLPHSGVGIPA